MQQLSTTYIELLAAYKSFLNSRNISTATKKQYLSDVRQFLISTETQRITDIKQELINRYLDVLRLQKKPLATLKRKRSSLSYFLHFLELTGVIKARVEIAIPGTSFFMVPKFHAYVVLYLLVFTVANGYFIFRTKSEESINKPDSFSLSGRTISNFDSSMPTYMALSREVEGVEGFTVSVDQNEEPYGQATIRPVKSEVAIYHQSITPTSLIFVTPVTELAAENRLSIKSQGEGIVTIQVSVPSSEPITFNWFSKNYSNSTTY